MTIAGYMQFHDLYIVEVIFIIKDAFLCWLMTDESLRVCIKLVCMILVPRLVVMAPVLVGIFDLIVPLEHFLVNQLARERVPE